MAPLGSALPHWCMNNSTGFSRIRRCAAQLARYGLIGVATNGLGYLAYLLITHWEISPILAMTLLYTFAAGMGFIGNRWFVFVHRGAALTSAARYGVAHILGYSINLFLLLTLNTWLGYPHQWVQAGAIIVVAGFLFLIFKYFVFPYVERHSHTIRGAG